MSDLLQEVLEGKIDFEGQRFTESLVRNVLIGSTVLSFLLGFTTQSLWNTFVLLGLVTTLLVIAVVPPWPYFTRHPVKWLAMKKVDKTQ
ncbi:microsomal signal peptidase [Pyrrhoderma noxium]|uniref:Signal peptidase complex subunit 1 n=1 Tax=Pyrrhoderma noxium TaxID=2282107 RepID=A0A286U5Q0_9AGAM|nr:microsomal signal peptidase [Pyrrhoderma noxium]